jgi:hypothetical protein
MMTLDLTIKSSDKTLRTNCQTLMNQTTSQTLLPLHLNLFLTLEHLLKRLSSHASQCILNMVLLENNTMSIGSKGSMRGEILM